MQRDPSRGLIYMLFRVESRGRRSNLSQAAFRRGARRSSSQLLLLPLRRAPGMLSLLWPIQLALLTFLHVAFAVSRLVFLLRQLPAATRRWIHLQLSADPPYLSNDVEHDRIRWKKTPTHLAVVFVPGTSLSTWNSRWLGGPQAEQRELGKLVKDVKALLGWCEELGMASLSVYDERGTWQQGLLGDLGANWAFPGVLDRNAEAVMTALSCPSFLSVSKEPHQSSGRTTFRVPLLNPRGRDGVEVPGREVDSGCGASEVESCDTGKLLISLRHFED